MNRTTSTPVHSETTTARISAPIDREERLIAGDAFRMRAIRRPHVAKRPFSRLSDGQTHPVTISRKSA